MTYIVVQLDDCGAEETRISVEGGTNYAGARVGDDGVARIVDWSYRFTRGSEGNVGGNRRQTHTAPRRLQTAKRSSPREINLSFRDVDDFSLWR